MRETNETFTYTYSAAQQEEIQAIRKKYLPAGEDKLQTLRKLDAGVTRKALAVSLAVGLLGTLVMGTGMSLIMTDLGQALGLGAVTVPGVVLGLLGMVGVIAAYPLQQQITKRERARIAPEILRLTKELSQDP